MTRYASVYPLVTARALAREFTYEVGDEVGPGAVVEVRFGNAKRRGVVTQVDVAPPQGIETSQIERVVEELPKPLVELALWIADYYGSTPGRAFALVAPVQRKARGERPQPAARDGLPGEAEPAELSNTQRAALDRIVGAFDADEGANFLLFGATGSGKTEVYLRACAVALERGRGAIVLVPEIALTPQTVGRFRARFGERIAILHSSLTEAERRDERARIASGEAPIVVGARSAVFAPVPRLGVICVDEEHDSPYKQESDPRCHHCGHTEPKPETCPACSSTELARLGAGTQKLERELEAKLPELERIRLDADAVEKPGALAAALRRFAAADRVVLVGTQMVAKGHHFSGVALAAVVDADTGLGMPDFRAEERTFQLLTQLAGRSGRDAPGRVLVQTFQPASRAIELAARHDVSRC